MNNKDKIVIFDWGGVVESHYQGEYNCYTAKVSIVNRLNEETKRYDKETILKKWESCRISEEGKVISELNSKADIEKWFEIIKLEFNLKCDYEEFQKVYQEERNKIEYYKDVVDFAHSLKDKCKIGILSNLITLDKERIDKQYNLSKFDFVWLSFELECRKPDEKIYKIVEEQCKISPERILFIDDKPSNLETAQKRGWNVCLATGHQLDKIKKSVNEFLN